MFKWLKKTPPPAPANSGGDIRQVLFGDLPFSQWPRTEAGAGAEAEPWASFIRARSLRDAGQTRESIQVLKEIVSRSDLESRHYLQAWHFLRELGIQPTDDPSHVYGVIVEVAMPKGLDILAAYEDHAARYYNYTGSGVVWERPDPSLDGYIDAVLESGRKVVAQIGPWTEPRRTALGENSVRINMLTPIGLHFGEGPMSVLSKDPIGGELLATATVLMQQLIAKTNVNKGHAS